MPNDSFGYRESGDDEERHEDLWVPDEIWDQFIHLLGDDSTHEQAMAWWELVKSAARSRRKNAGRKTDRYDAWLVEYNRIRGEYPSDWKAACAACGNLGLNPDTNAKRWLKKSRRN